jgi:hypothetical protein
MSSGRNWTFFNDVTVNGTLTATVGSFSVADGSITTAKLADSAVTTAKIATDAVTSAQIAAAAVGSSEIATGAVTATELGSSAVTTVKIDALAVTTAKIADANVTNAKIADGAISTAKIASGAVNNAALAANAVDTTNIATGAVTTTKIADNAVDTLQLALDSVSVSRLGASSVTSKVWSPNTSAGGTANNCIWTVSGSGYLFARSTGTSEAKYKKEIATFSSSPEIFSQLRFVEFKYDPASFVAEGQTEIIVPEEKQYGLIIDELEIVVPSAVNPAGVSAPNKTINWDYIRNLQSVALQSALTRIAALEARVAELEA